MSLKEIAQVMIDIGIILLIIWIVASLFGVV